jgi:hypothetical protein
MSKPKTTAKPKRANLPWNGKGRAPKVRSTPEGKFRTAANAYLADPQNPSLEAKVINTMEALGMQAPCTIRYQGRRMAKPPSSSLPGSPRASWTSDRHPPPSECGAARALPDQPCGPVLGIFPGPGLFVGGQFTTG